MPLNPLLASMKANDPYEMLISNIITYESQPLYRLEDKKGEQERFKNILSDFDSEVSGLHTMLKGFQDTISNPFAARAADVPEDVGFSVSASDDAAFGTHTLQVDRLASTDTRLSKQYTKSGTDLRAFFDANGAQSFSIDVASPTDADPDNRISIAIDIDPAGTTDDEILKELSVAINDAMFGAVEAGTIDPDEAAAASVVNETSGTSRLSLRSGGTGFANRLQFSDSANGLLSAVTEIANAGVASGTGGGQVTDVGTSETDSQLNARFQLDGLTMYRSSNEINDALDGLSLNLRSVGTEPTEFKVNPDEEAISGEIKDFVDKYNKILSFVRDRSEVDGDLDVRGPLAGDSGFRSLVFSMRTDVIQSVPGQASDAPQMLTDLGIEIERDGTLKIEDEDKLLDFVRQDAFSVQRLFTNTDGTGLADRLKTRIDGYVGVNGIMDNRIESAEKSLERTTDQIGDFESRMSAREDSLRRQYAQLQQTLQQLQGQQSYLGGFMYGMF